MPVDSDSLGAYLRQERERRRVSLQEIAATTKIQLKFLEALENDAYDQLPAAPFVAGFLRAYAQQIALDPDLVLGAYRALQQTPESGEEARVALEVPLPVAARLPRLRLAGLVLLLVLGLGLLVYELRRGRQAQSPVASFPAPLQTPLAILPKPAAPEVPPVAPPPPAGPVPASAPPSTVPPAASSHDVQPPPETPGADTVPSLTQAAATSSPPKSNAGPPAAQPSLLVLQAQALEDTWLRLEIDEQQSFSLLLKAGKSLTWEAHERFRLTIGNAHGTRLALNGQDITLPSGRGNVIRDLLLTRSSLP